MIESKSRTRSGGASQGDDAGARNTNGGGAEPVGLDSGAALDSGVERGEGHVVARAGVDNRASVGPDAIDALDNSVDGVAGEGLGSRRSASARGYIQDEDYASPSMKADKS